MHSNDALMPFYDEGVRFSEIGAVLLAPTVKQVLRTVNTTAAEMQKRRVRMKAVASLFTPKVRLPTCSGGRFDSGTIAASGEIKHTKAPPEGAVRGVFAYRGKPGVRLKPGTEVRYGTEGKNVKVKTREKNPREAFSRRRQGPNFTRLSSIAMRDRDAIARRVGLAISIRARA